MLATYVLTDQSKFFPRNDGQIYEPEGIKLVYTPLYIDPSKEYYNRVHANCTPIFFEKSLRPDHITQALADFVALRKRNELTP